MPCVSDRLLFNRSLTPSGDGGQLTGSKGSVSLFSQCLANDNIMNSTRPLLHVFIWLAQCGAWCDEFNPLIFPPSMCYSDRGSREAKELPEALIDEEEGTWGLRRRKSGRGWGQGGLGPKSASSFPLLLSPASSCFLWRDSGNQ